MEPEGLLPHLQVPLTCPYSAPDQSSPCLPIPLTEDPSYYYLFIYARVLPVVSFLQVPPTRILHTPLLALIRATCPTHLMLRIYIS